jgi:hypothetical protein
MPINNPKPPLDIEQLKKRHKELEKQKTTIEANLQTAIDQLDALKAESRQRFGTDDLDELKRKLDAMRQENEQKRAQYQSHLEQIELRLAEVERQSAAKQNQEPT